MRRIAVAALLLGLALPAWAAGAADDPAAVVRALYAADEPSFHDTSRDDVLTDARLRGRFFTRTLGRAIAKDRAGQDGEPGNLDFDPVSDSQDPMVKNLTATLVSGDARQASVEVRFSRGEGNPPTRLTYTLVREGSAWKVDDIAKPDGGGEQGWDLRRIVGLPAGK